MVNYHVFSAADDDDEEEEEEEDKTEEKPDEKVTHHTLQTFQNKEIVLTCSLIVVFFTCGCGMFMCLS